VDWRLQIYRVKLKKGVLGSVTFNILLSPLLVSSKIETKCEEWLRVIPYDTIINKNMEVVIEYWFYTPLEFIWEYVVVQLVEAPLYEPEGHEFDSWWGHWDWFSFQLHCGPGVDSSYNRNEYQGCLLGVKASRCIGLTTLPPSCADCLEILGVSTSWSPKGLSRRV
jgi:hypothetical protein